MTNLPIVPQINRSSCLNINIGVVGVLAAVVQQVRGGD